MISVQCIHVQICIVWIMVMDMDMMYVWCFIGAMQMNSTLLFIRIRYTISAPFQRRDRQRLPESHSETKCFDRHCSLRWAAIPSSMGQINSHFFVDIMYSCDQGALKNQIGTDIHTTIYINGIWNCMNMTWNNNNNNNQRSSSSLAFIYDIYRNHMYGEVFCMWCH